MKQRHLRRCTLALLLGATLAACGGGGGSPGATGSNAGAMPAVDAGVTLALTDRSGIKLERLVGQSTGVVTALVLTSGGNPAVNTRVQFSISEGPVIMSPADGSVLTNSLGEAMVNVRGQDTQSSGSVTVTATVPTLGTGVKDEISVQVIPGAEQT